MKVKNIIVTSIPTYAQNLNYWFFTLDNVLFLSTRSFTKGISIISTMPNANNFVNIIISDRENERLP